MHGTGAPLGRHTTDVPAEAAGAARRVAEVLQQARRVLVLGHAGADGDVCGSSLGLAAALRELGKEVVVYNEERYPDAWRWLPGGSAVATTLNARERFDCTVAVDAARPERLGRDFPPPGRRGTFVWIDHHKIDPAPGDVSYVDPTAAAVGEQVAAVLEVLGHPLSLDVAQCLYASLLADTGGFRYGNTSARAFRLAARLVEAGVDPWLMTERIYESQDEARMRLLGKVLSSMWLSPCGRAGLVEVRAHDMSRFGARAEHVQGLVNHVRGIKGVEIAVLLRELPDGTAVVLRSRGNIAAAPIAAALGGRGHKNAATFTVEGDLASTRQRVVEAVLAALPAVEPTKGERAAE
ncbi:MAG: bifunctional oligoribonuclease/PAP phosphatase NrnA [Deltaproteobacteria bacterium]|nr:bifunctional oligoribonuclease/PAP phosphatase NrnA [Deltaproteobacteria bacterium]